MAWRLRRGGEMATERSDGAKRRQRRVRDRQEGERGKARELGRRWAVPGGKIGEGKEGGAWLRPIFYIFFFLFCFSFSTEISEKERIRK